MLKPNFKNYTENDYNMLLDCVLSALSGPPSTKNLQIIYKSSTIHQLFFLFKCVIVIIRNRVEIFLPGCFLFQKMKQVCHL